MRAAVISIGTELFINSKADANGPYINSYCTNLGWQVQGRFVIPDDETPLTELLNVVLKLADFVFITGGLGGTRDDSTIEFLGRYMGLQTENDSLAMDRLLKAYKARYAPDDAERRFKQHPGFQTLAGAECIENRVGIASGHLVTFGQKTLFILPGVPRENRDILENARLRLTGLPKDFSGVSFSLYDMTETEFEQRFFEGYELPKGIDYGISFSVCRLTLNFWSGDVENVQTTSRMAQIEERLYKIFGRENFCADLDAELAMLLLDQGRKMTTAESCTGGLIAGRMTDRPGSSAYFEGGMVTYSNEQKIAQLKVLSETLAAHGAVSQEVVTAMATGALLDQAGAVAIAVSGIAGPGGGTDEKPVGLVWTDIAVRQADGQVEHHPMKLFIPGRSRDFIREYTVVYTLNRLRLLLTAKAR